MILVGSRKIYEKLFFEKNDAGPKWHKISQAISKQTAYNFNLAVHAQGPDHSIDGFPRGQKQGQRFELKVKCFSIRGLEM